MNSFKNILRSSLETGFIDLNFESDDTFRPKLLTNEPKAKIKVQNTIIKELRNCQEFIFSVAFLTTGGIAPLVGILKDLEEKNIKGKILVSQYLNFTQPEALRVLRQFSNIELKIATIGDFHSKGYIFKNDNHYNLIIGSSNLTLAALSKNKEWNLKVTTSFQSEIIQQTLIEFDKEFEKATSVDDEFIRKYSFLYNTQKRFTTQLEEGLNLIQKNIIEPNLMQISALENIQKLREQGKNKALLISATGTGKTFLSAFDVKSFKPRKFLFVVHRLNIAKKAMESFKTILGDSYRYGLFSGSEKSIEADLIFSTIQTISKDDNLKRFQNDEFDYIVIDETHRANASSYQKLMSYFNPKFLLGMTATPDRTDGLNVYEQFEYNIAYEIRLYDALENDMLCPFHYYGVSDIEINGELLAENYSFNDLEFEKRVNHIIEKIKYFGSDDGIPRGLIFCSNQNECKTIAEAFNKRGIKSIALTAENSEDDRMIAINLLESDDLGEKIDYIFTVDIFNEGVDIPKINQIVMLRPTQSSIIFIQQLGRGLRKTTNKEYVTVIDFIANYKNNFLIPIALFGDTSFNKDTLRKLMVNSNLFIPGSSSIYFERVIKEKIFESINNSNLQTKNNLLSDYHALKYKIGRIPTMIDFLQYGARDPFSYVEYSKSYFNFISTIEKITLQEELKKLLEFFSKEICNVKRIEESILLKSLVLDGELEITDFSNEIKSLLNMEVNQKKMNSYMRNLNFEFVTENLNGKLIPLNIKYSINNIELKSTKIILSNEFKQKLENIVFKESLMDAVNYSIEKYLSDFDSKKLQGGFVLYRKYSRKDVFRILDWIKNPVSLNVGGYMISDDKSNCALFVNYKKEDSISSTTKYEDQFLNHSTFQWMSKNNRTLISPDVKTIIESQTSGIRIPLFIKKSNDEGDEFYFMGDLSLKKDNYEQEEIFSETKNKHIPIVKFIFDIRPKVQEDLFGYITELNFEKYSPIKNLF